MIVMITPRCIAWEMGKTARFNIIEDGCKYYKKFYNNLSLILVPINFINEKLTFLHSREIFKAILFDNIQDQLGIQSMMGRNFIYFSGTFLIARI